MASLLPWLLLLFLAPPASSSALSRGPRLGVREKSFARKGSSHRASGLPQLGDDFQLFNYTQTLDHFNYDPQSYTTFRQRYAVNFKYWGGVNNSSPIFVYTGDEIPMEYDIEASGLIQDVAPRFNALLVYIEHRYYGESIPFGSEEEAYSNSTTLGYFSSAQALADYAEVILWLKNNLSADSCPVTVYGGSYGGMLAAWFRLKYPHIAMAALASSAPILYFDDITPENGYYSVVTKDFREVSESCYSTIRQSWFDIDMVASLPGGLDLLGQKFKTCSLLNDTQELKDVLDGVMCAAAQYNYPPRYPVSVMCEGIDGAVGNDTLDRIVAGVVALYGNYQCMGVTDDPVHKMFGWTWQSCSEMVMPIGRSDNDTMFQAMPFDINKQTDLCQQVYGVTPRPHWITTEFGGHNITQVLEKFASNIIFSNGLRDPYSVGGVLQNISDSVVAIHTDQGAHCMDLFHMSSSNPEWLTKQQAAELSILEGWIADYKSKLAP